MNATETPIYRRVVRWYDRRTRNWVVQVKDAAGNQIGEAKFNASEREAKAAQKYWRGVLLCGGRVVLEKLKPIYA